MEDRTSGRWIGPLVSPARVTAALVSTALVSAALLLGACGSGSTESGSTDDLETEPTVLALEEETSPSDAIAESVPADDATTTAFDIDEFSSLDDLEAVELTPEVFGLLKSDETARAAILEEMEAQGLSGEEAVCFLDEVSPGLFIAFGTGEQPNDAQFGELLGLLDTCGIAFGAQS